MPQPRQKSAPAVGFNNVVYGVTTPFSAATTTTASLVISDGASEIYSVLFPIGTTLPFSRTFAAATFHFGAGF
jgi:hypothetical protein